MRLAWEEYAAEIDKLIESLGDYRPDVIVPCMLGGLIPGAIMAKRLGINDVRPIDIEREGGSRRLAYDIQGDVSGKNLLLVEDDIPTGKGPAQVKKLFESRGARVRIAALYVSPESRLVTDFYVRVLSEFPDYPWKSFHQGDRIRYRER